MALTRDQVRVETIAIERVAVKAHASVIACAIDKEVKRGRLSEDEGRLAKRQIRLFAESVTSGLHIQAVDVPAVRVAVRAALGVAGG